MITQRYAVTVALATGRVTMRELADTYYEAEDYGYRLMADGHKEWGIGPGEVQYFVIEKRHCADRPAARSSKDYVKAETGWRIEAGQFTQLPLWSDDEDWSSPESTGC